MKKATILSVILIFSSALFSGFQKTESQTRIIINKMLHSIDIHQGCVYSMKNEERVVNMKELRGGEILTKINVKPFKEYMKMVSDPNKGTEILYAEGERSGKALVNPGKFLPTLKLSPYNSLLTKEQHHTILSSGFTIVAKIINESIKKADALGKFDSIYKYAGDVTWNGKNCYKIIIEDPTWKFTIYTAQKGENMYTVALKFLIPEYSMVELDGVRNFEEDLGGKTLKIPTSYSKRTVFYIDKESNFPVFQEMSDDKGVFERYQFFNLVINPVFKADEFTQDFPEYKF